MAFDANFAYAILGTIVAVGVFSMSRGQFFGRKSE